MLKQKTRINSPIRQLLIRESARLMYEENIKQYYDAKKIAVKRLFGQGRRKSTSVRTKDLPSNGEISEELAKLVQFYEGSSAINAHLFNMRILALDIMEQLEHFRPRLIGSVSTGRIRKDSDIDLHVFTDNYEEFEAYLLELKWNFEIKQVFIRNNNRIKEYTHIYLSHAYPVEISIYPTHDIRVRPISSTDMKPIIRLSSDKLMQLILDEHGEKWNNYLTGNKPNVSY